MIYSSRDTRVLNNEITPIYSLSIDNMVIYAHGELRERLGNYDPLVIDDRKVFDEINKTSTTNAIVTSISLPNGDELYIRLFVWVPDRDLKYRVRGYAVLLGDKAAETLARDQQARRSNRQ